MPMAAMHENMRERAREQQQIRQEAKNVVAMARQPHEGRGRAEQEHADHDA